MNKSYILFDLDGTLTKSAEGILNSVRYALREMSFDVPDGATLNRFLGPPLVDSFQKYCKMSVEQAQEALRLYRVYFKEKGIYENKPYDGVPEMLNAVQNSGKKAVLATSKPEEFANIICKHFGLSQYLFRIVGATMDGAISKKADVVRLALESCKIDAADAVMVGDRANDVDGAHFNGVPCIGVLYGYGSRTELADADFLVSSPKELTELLCE